MHTIHVLSGLFIIALTACSKEELARPTAHTFSRVMNCSPSGLQLDTAYATSQISLRAITWTDAQGNQNLTLYFGDSDMRGYKEAARLEMALNKMRPGWVGTYTFYSSQGTALPNIPVGDAKLYHLLRFYGNNIAALAGGTDDTGNGRFIITKYDAKRHLLSGSFHSEVRSNISLPPLASQLQSYRLVLTSTFENLPVTQ